MTIILRELELVQTRYLPLNGMAPGLHSFEPSGSSFAEAGTYLVARDFQSRVAPNETQRNTLIVAGAYVLIIGILWWVVNDIRRTSSLGLHIVVQACSIREQNLWVAFCVQYPIHGD